MYNILIVEDSKPILRDIERLIRENLKETEIETAYDGEEALEIIQHLEPDILFTDIKMPLMDGLSLIEKAKQRRFRNAPCLAACAVFINSHCSKSCKIYNQQINCQNQ